MNRILVLNASVIDGDLYDLVQKDHKSEAIRGFIHSVYTNVINIHISIRNEPEFLLLATKRVIQSPGMIMVGGITDFRQDGLHIKPADPVEISIYQLLVSDQLQINLTKAAHWHKNIDSIPFISKKQSLTAYHFLNGYMQMAGHAGGCKHPWLDIIQHKAEWSTTIHERALRQQMIILHEAVAERNMHKVLESIQPLIGLGVGLTPSGDDFIAGFVFTLQALTHPLSKQVTDHKYRLIGLAHKRTTAVSSHMLKHAFQGKANEALIDLLISMAESSDLIALKSHADRLLTIGSSSGTDMLAGVLFALHGKIQNYGGLHDGIQSID